MDSVLAVWLVVISPPGVNHTVFGALFSFGFNFLVHFEKIKLAEPPLSSSACKTTGFDFLFLVLNGYVIGLRPSVFCLLFDD